MCNFLCVCFFSARARCFSKKIGMRNRKFIWYGLTFLPTRLLEALYEDLPVESIKFEVYHYYSGLIFMEQVSFWLPLEKFLSCNLFIIRDCISTMYVGMAYQTPPTNTNFQITLLPTRLLEANYLYRA